MNPWIQLVLGNVIVAALIGLVAWAVGRSGRRAPLAHALWIAVFVKLITPPTVSVPIPISSNWLPEVAVAAERLSSPADQPSDLAGRERPHSASTDPKPAKVGAAGEPQAVAISVKAGAGASEMSGAIGLWTWLVMVWVAGTVGVVTLGVLRFWRFGRLLRRAGSFEAEATEFVAELLAASGSRRRPPHVLTLPVRVSPMLLTAGRRVVIVCPRELWRTLGATERRAFLAHEAAHFRRFDHWVRWLEWAVTAAYWWLPLVHLARGQLVRHEEACCDAWAVRQLSVSPRRYAETLLCVVDFLSERRGGGLPRLASGMQATRTLEERLRLLRDPLETHAFSGPVQRLAGVGCVALWLLHPSAHLQPSPAAVSVRPDAATAPNWDAALSPEEVTAEPAAGRTTFTLPEPPRGFWNQTPPRRWANFSLSLPGAELIGEAGRGVAITVGGHEPLSFPRDALSAIVEIPSTQRVVIGNEAGELRLWDLAAGVPVSLIGRHAAAVTSVAYRDGGGLASADEAGSVVRWDLQSGQMLASWSDTTDGVQSVRFSCDGTSLAILTGRWEQAAVTRQVLMVDSRSLEVSRSFTVPGDTAVVLEHPGGGWLTVSWSGDVRSLETMRVVSAMAKEQVSALVLSQQSEASVLSDLGF